MEKLKNFWYYHKYHVLFAVFMLIFVIMTVSECVGRKKPDIGIGYVSISYIESELLSQTVSKDVKDVNGDGESYAEVTTVIFSEQPQMDVDISLGQKVNLMLASGDYQIYIMDKEFISTANCMDLFIDLSDMIPEEMKEDAVMRGDEIIGIKTTYSKYLNDAGVSGDNIYIGISMVVGDKKNDKDAHILFENAKEFFKNNIVK